MQRCPYCGKIISDKKRHRCFEKDAIRDVRPTKWKIGVKK